MIWAHVFRIAASWWTFTALIAAFAAVYLRFAFSQDPYPAWISFVTSSLAGSALSAGLLANLLMINLRIIVDRSRSMPAVPSYVRRMDSWTVVPKPAGGLDDVAAWLSSRGFDPNGSDDSVSSLKGRYSYLPGVILRTGVAMLLAGLFISSHIRTTETVDLHAGESAAVIGTDLTLASIETDLPADFLKVGESKSLEIENTAVRIQANGHTYQVSPGFPARIGTASVALNHLGYTQDISIAGAQTAGRRFDLDLLPPGKTDTVRLGKDDLTLALSPERTITKGLLTGEQYNLASPRYRIRLPIGSGRGKQEEVVLRSGEGAAIGGLVLTMGQTSRYARIAVVRDPALPFVRAGIVLALAGLCLMPSRFFWHRREFLAVRDGSSILIGYSEEFFRKWGIAAFEDWRNSLYLSGRPGENESDAAEAKDDAAKERPGSSGIPADHDQG